MPEALAILGCGEVTLHKHFPALRRLPEWTVAAVADLDSTAREAAERLGIARRVGSIEELLELPSIDAVAISVPPRAHTQAAVAALRAGKHVWIDKPLALTEADCELIAAESARSTGKLLVGFHMRWHPLVLQARELIRSGALGPIESVRSVWNSPRQDAGLPDWRWRRATGGGALIEIGVHHFDLWRFLLDREVECVQAVTRDGTREDESAAVLARLDGGIAATAMLDERAPHQIEIEICGRDGRLRVDCLRFEGLELSTHRDVPGGASTRLRRMAHFVRALPRGLHSQRRGGDYRDSYAGAWGHFARVIRGLEPPGCTAEDGLRATGIALAAARSTRRAVSTDPPRGTAPENEAVEFSIVVPTHNRPAQVTDLLGALRVQRLSKELFEVVLVDDGSAEPLGEIIEPHRDGLCIRLVETGHNGCSSARQAGAIAARGRYLVFTDDDCLPAPDWLTIIAEATRLNPGAALGGRVVCSLNGNPFAVASQLVVNRFTASRESNFFPTNNLTFPADGFRTIGGMPSNWSNAGGEDRELCARWTGSGRTLAALPEALVFHQHHLTLRTFWRQHLRYGRGAALYRIAVPGARFRPATFYAGLLVAPFRDLPMSRAIVVSGLVALSQAATLCGFLLERFRPRLRMELPDRPRPARDRQPDAG